MKSGVTLVEILIVIGIISLLASMVIGLGGGIDNQAREQALQGTFALLESALQEYHEYTGVFPNMIGTTPTVHSAALYGQLQSIPTSRKIVEKLDASQIGDVDNNGYSEFVDPWGVVLDYRYTAGTDTFPRLISAGLSVII